MNIFSTKAGTYNFIYSIGAAIVIIGALFKMTHWHIGPLGGNFFLAFGLITEAIIFTVFAFDPPKDEEYAWENVYPELLNKSTSKPKHHLKATEVKDLEMSLSDKLDKMLSEAKLDVSLFERLKTGIDKFSNSVEDINKSVDVSQATQKYNDQLTLAASHLENMNALYSLQLDHGRAASEYYQKYISDLQQSSQYSERFNQELNGLTQNVNSLNRVYGGMLSAMKS